MNTQCSIAFLESALAGNLPADDEDLLHRHLEECAECCAALEHMAGGPAWCQEAAALLARDELDAAVSACEEWSAVDFTVEHLEPTDAPNVLGRLGGYDVLEIIGRGGMGVVLKGFDRELKRCVAIKVLSPQLAQSSLARKRFAREARAAAAVVHPNVLAIHQVQPSARLPFLVMPLVAGESLAQRLTAQGRLELKETLRIGMQAAAGLAAAHEQGLVHRDVKPANILLEKGVERAVLTDFGLARAADDVTLTRWGVIAGTPQYMSPEQARGEPLDGRSDLFSLGCVLYEMATGVSPFRADSVMATMRRLVDDPPQAMASLNPELPPWIIDIVERLLEKDPSRRFNSAKEVSELLEGCLAHLQQPTSVRLPAALSKPAFRRAWRPRVLGFGGVLVMTAALGIGLLGMFLLSTQPPEIAGEWSGEDWGHIVLKKTSDGKYTGTYSDTVGEQPGKIQLKWSRIERRFNGTWHEGEDRFGELSVRVVDGEIRGALTTDSKSRTNPATPRLADLKWTRPGLAQGSNTAAAEMANQPEQSHPNATAGAKTAKEQKEAWRWREHSGLPFEITNSIGMKLVLIPPGEFTMGSPRELIKEELKTPGLEDWYKDRLPGEGPQHLVRITRPFYFGVYLVTQEEYQRVMGTNPSEFSAAGNGKGKVAGEDIRRCPVENVSWNGALEFCRKLSNLPEEQSAGRAYQLPSEAQWEYACRAGSTGRFSFSPDGDAVSKESENSRLCDFGWFDGNSGGRTHPVGEKKPSAWGLFDMHGNVWEWCQDWYGKDYYAKSPVDDPTGPLAGTYRACRGGGCRVPAWRCGSASRGNREPGLHYGGLGFRVAQVLKDIRVENVQGAEGKVEKTGEVKSTPKRMHRFAALTTGHSMKTACSADGKLLAIANGNPTMIMMGGGRSKAADNWQPTVKILNVETGKTVASLKLTTADEDAVLTGTDRVSHLEATALAFSPDGSMVAVGTSIGQVKLFSARTGELVRSLDDAKAKLADKQTPEKWRSLRRAMGSVVSIAFSPDGKQLALCGGSFADFSEGFDEVERLGSRSTGPGRLKLWDVTTGALNHDLLGHNEETYAVAFSPNGNWLASAGRWMDDGDPWGNGVILWNARSGEQIHRLIRTNANAGARAIAFSPDGTMLAMGTQRFGDDKAKDSSTGGVSLVNVSSGIEQWLVTVPGWAQPLAFSSDGKSVVALCGGRSIRFLEIGTGTMKCEIQPDDSQEGVQWDDFAIASQGQVLAIGGVDNKQSGSVEVWSTRNSDNTNLPAATSQRQATTARSGTMRNFTTGISVRTIACSEDGKLAVLLLPRALFPFDASFAAPWWNVSESGYGIKPISLRINRCVKRR